MSNDKVAPRRRLKKTSIGETLLALEPRFMFDAAGIATGAELAADALAQSQADAAVAGTQPSWGDSADSEQTLALALGGRSGGEPRREIIFIDPQVEGYASIVAAIGPGAETVLLDPARDGLGQVAAVLDGRSDLDAIHLVSHGGEAELNFGRSTITAASMAGEHTQALARLGNALGKQGDVLIYGCNFGAGDAGHAAVAALSRATGADVAASDDATGSAARGGDWALETRAGTIETRAVAAEAFAGLLATPVAGDDPGAATPTTGDADGATLAASAGGSTANFTGNDGPTFSLNRGDGSALTADGTAGLGRLNTDASAGASEDYTLTLNRPENTVSLSITSLDNSADRA